MEFTLKVVYARAKKNKNKVTSKMSDAQKRLEFVEKKLPLLILESNNEFKNHIIVKSSVETKNQLDGFMSALFLVDLTLKNENGV